MAYNPNDATRLKHTAQLAQVVKSNQDDLLADISGKVDKVNGKGLSTNDYTTTEKNKLASIAAGAQVNVIETVKVNGTALTPSSKAVNIDISGKVDKVNGKGLSTNDYTTTEKNKLAGIDEQANKYVLPVATSATIGGVKVDSVANSNIVLSSGGNISVPVASTSQAGVVKLGGDSSKYLNGTGQWATPTNTTYAVATSSANGLMSANDKKILDSVPSVYAKLSADNTFSGGNTFSGKVILSKTTDASGTAAGNCALQIGDTAGTHLEFDGNEIMAKSNVSTPSVLHLNNDGGKTYFGDGGVSVKGGGVTVAAGGLTAANQTITAGTIKGAAASFTGNVTANNVYVPVGGRVGYNATNGMKILDYYSSYGADIIVQACSRLMLSAGETGMNAYNNTLYGSDSITPNSEEIHVISDKGVTFWCNASDNNSRKKIIFAKNGNVTMPGTVTATTFDGNVTNATTGYSGISTAAAETVKSATISNLDIRVGTLVALNNTKAGTSSDSTEINLSINGVAQKAYKARSTPMKNSDWVAGYYLFVYSGSNWLCLSYPG